MYDNSSGRINEEYILYECTPGFKIQEILSDIESDTTGMDSDYNTNFYSFGQDELIESFIFDSRTKDNDLRPDGSDVSCFEKDYAWLSLEVNPIELKIVKE